MARFRDREDAGRRLAALVKQRAQGDDALVLGLARGGVPVAHEVARLLGAPLDVLVVRKLGVPGHEELAMGAIAPGGARVVNADVIETLGISESVVDEVAAREATEIARREREYRRGAPPARVTGRPVIAVDDGLATGATMRAAVASLRAAGATRVIVAVPTGSRETCEELRTLADEVICLCTPDPFLAVGNWYEDFATTTDDDVREHLASAVGERRRGPRGEHHHVRT